VIDVYLFNDVFSVIDAHAGFAHTGLLIGEL